MALQDIEEKDKAGTIVATYVPSLDGRIDIIVRMHLRPLMESCQAYGIELGLF